MSIHPSIHPYIYICPFIHLSIHIYVHSSIYPSIYMSIHPSIHPYICPFIHLSVHIYVHSSIYQFIHPLIDQDNTQEVVRIMATKSFSIVVTATGKVHTRPFNPYVHCIIIIIVHCPLSLVLLVIELCPMFIHFIGILSRQWCSIGYHW